MHSSLRSLNFWRVILINLLVSVFVYMLMPWWPTELAINDNMPFQTCGQMMLLFCLGLFLPGCVSSYMLDKYPRKAVCFWTILVLLAVSHFATMPIPIWCVAVCRLVQGAAFALFHIALGSTILIDITVSGRRDIASYIYFWVCKLSMAAGPAIGIMALRPDFWKYLCYLPLVCAALAVYFILRIKLPFRTPLGNKLFSTDRFWLPGTMPLVILLFVVALALGVDISLNQHPLFYAYLFIGLVLSMVFHFVVFYRADTRAEIVTGYLSAIAGFLLLLTQKNPDIEIAAAIFTGYGVGNVSGRMLSFFTAVSDHTDRGSAQVTYKLTFESGLCLGFFVPCITIGIQDATFYLCILVLLVFAVSFYLLFVHQWFLRHNKR